MEENEGVDLKLDLIAKSSVIVFIALILSKVMTYIYKIVIGRYYGPESYGFFSLGSMVLGIFTAIVGIGLSGGLHRFLPIYLAKGEKEKYNYAISFSKNILIFTGVVGTFSMFFLSGFIAEYFFHSPELAVYLRIFSFIIPISLFSGVYFSIIRANEKITVYSFGTSLLETLPKTIFILIFAFIGMKASSSISFSLLLGFLSMALFGLIYSRKIKNFNGSSKKNKIDEYEKKKFKKEFFSYSWPLFLFGVVSSLIFWVDNFAIGYLKGAYWVGIYNAAIPLAMLLMTTSEMFMQLFFPIITKEISKGNKYVSSELTKQVFKWIFAINLPLVSFIVLFPGVFINFFWGAEYLLVKNSLIFLSLGYFVFSLASVSNNILSSIGKSKTVLANLGILSILNLTLNFLLIPKYGIDGAAFATMTSLFVWSTLLIIEAGYFSKIFPFRRKMINVLFSAGITTGGMYFFTDYFNFGVAGLILFAIIYSMVYFTMLILTKSLDENDWKILKKIRKKKDDNYPPQYL